MKWSSSLEKGVILKRYKRFLADVLLDGQELTVHVPNTGSMTSCWGPNWRCAVSKSDNSKRKLPYTLELTHNGDSWIGVNTANANKVVKEWLEENLIQELSGYKTITPEKKTGESRIDFYLEDHTYLPPCYVEVKSVTLKSEGAAKFPDAVSERGQKHLNELTALKKNGFRSVMLFVVQREDVHCMKPANEIDPRYAKLLFEANKFGVEILVYQCQLSLEGIKLGNALPFQWE